MSEVETIFALSTGALPAAIAVIRVSGPAVPVIAEAMTGGLAEPRRAVLRIFRHPDSAEALDEGLAIFFPASSSVTGEPLLELHCHGSRAVVAAMNAALSTIPNVRAAEPGEFTRRAFANGRMDLSRVEGLGDLLAAETEAQRRAALHMMEGRFFHKIAGWRQQLLVLSAQIEARIDFADESDVAENAGSDLRDALSLLHESLTHELSLPSSERLKDGFRVVIAGPPNAGKSTLFNALLGRDAAIVTDIAGTTRDLLEAPFSLGGYPFVLIDSAGLRDAGTDVVEAIGIARAGNAVSDADIVLWLGDRDEAPRSNGQVVHLLGKADLGDGADGEVEGLAVSGVTGQGLNELAKKLVDAARLLSPREDGYALSARQRGIVQRVCEAVGDASHQSDEILQAELLRSALAGLSELTGEVATEAMLDQLFSGFCIGK